MSILWLVGVDEWFICGLFVMVIVVCEILIEYGVDFECIYLELFYGFDMFLVICFFYVGVIVIFMLFG